VKYHKINQQSVGRALLPPQTTNMEQQTNQLNQHTTNAGQPGRVPASSSHSEPDTTISSHRQILT